MKTLFKNGTVVNVFTDTLERTNVLIENDKIVGIGDYTDADADIVKDITGKYVTPGLIDGHIHIESTMMTPGQLAKIVLLHGTTGIVADPHEIANVCGMVGIKYMLESSKNLPLNVYLMLPSCVPATSFDESGAVLTADDLDPLYMAPRVLGLAEMMNYPGTIAGDPSILQKIADAKANNKVVDGHAPLLSGKGLDKYLSAGIQSDHECSTYEEATERIRKGQWLMIRQGTAARNLDGLIDLFDEPWNRRCLLVTDDKHPADLINDGHIDHIIRLAVKKGKSALAGIRMATIQAATCFGLKNVGAVAPGYKADILILNNLNTMDIADVYCSGKPVVENKSLHEFDIPMTKDPRYKDIYNSFFLDRQRPEDFHIEEKSNKCRVIKCIPDQLLTDEAIMDIDWSKNNGVDIENDILKIAVIERHMNTGHRGLGFISGLGLKKGAIAASISHDSHNLVIVGTNEKDMANVANCVIEMRGGCACSCDGEIIAKLDLPIAGLMANEPADVVAEKHSLLRSKIRELGCGEKSTPLMTMAFVSLSVIPSLKMTTQGLVDVNKQELVSLYV